MYAKAQHDFCIHKKEIMLLIQKDMQTRGGRIVFTGHSLGGGIALIAHACALFLARSEEHKQYLQNVTLQSITFAAPMVFFIPEKMLFTGTDEELREDADAVKYFKEHFQNHSVNHVFEKDVVPRLPGIPEFYTSALKRAMASFAKDQVVTLGGAESIADFMIAQAGNFSEKFVTPEFMEKTFSELKQYRHLSTVMLYTYEESGEDHDKIKTQCIRTEEEQKQFMSDVPKDLDEDWQYLLQCHSFLPHSMKPQK